MIFMTVEELKKKYSSIERIKRGGQKTVFKAKCKDGQTVALKIIPNTNDARVIQEIELVKDILIENVPVIYDHGIVHDDSIGEDVLYIVEEYIEGQSLRDYLKEGKKLTLTEAFLLLNTLLEIEMQLEDRMILHRDINPNNIILGETGRIYLIDFGLAKNMNGQSLTRTTAAHGPFTPGYAPYEQFANMKIVQDVRTDLFQIGVTIYESCTGGNPFVKPNEAPYEIMSRTLTMIPNPLVIPGDTKGMFAELVNMLMAKNQSQRPESAKTAMRYLMAIKPTLLLKED